MTDPAALGDDVPHVILAGRQWPIPDLTWRPLSKCRSQLIELNDRLGEAIKASTPEGEEGPVERAQRSMAAAGQVFSDLSNEDYDRLVMGPLHAALTCAHPSLTRDEFDGWATSDGERHLAWFTVRRQSGLFVIASAASENEPGEEGGAA